MLVIMRFTTVFFEIIWHIRSLVLFFSLWLAFGAVLIAFVEKIPFGDAVYFSFITGLTIGYGDVVMKTFTGRLISVLIGLTGIIFTGLIVAAAVETIRKVIHQKNDKA